MHSLTRQVSPAVHRRWVVIAAASLVLFLLHPVPSTDRAVAKGAPRCAGLRADVVGTEGDDVLIVRGVRNRAVVVAGLGGDDVIVVKTRKSKRTAVEAVCGGAGNDDIRSGTQNHQAVTDEGDTELFGGPGDDVIEGEFGYAFISGGPGNDSITSSDPYGAFGAPLVGDEGADEIIGGPAEDSIFADADDTLLDGAGGGGDELHFELMETGLHLDISQGSTISGMERLYLTDFDDSVSLEGWWPGCGENDCTLARVEGLDGNDRIIGTPKGDLILGGRGDDVLEGLGQSDLLYGGESTIFETRTGNDHITGGADVDFLHGGDGDDVLIDDKGRDQIEGGSGDDVLEGGVNDDYMYGGPGNDHLDGGSNPEGSQFEDSDYLYGGSEIDTCLRGEHIDGCEETAEGLGADQVSVREHVGNGDREATAHPVR